MKWSDVCLQSLLNLWQRKARTLLTVLGVIIGTASIVMMLALGEGNEQMFIEQVSQNINLTQIEVSGMGGGGAYAMPVGAESESPTAELDDRAIEAMRSIEGVKSVFPYTNASVYGTSRRYDASIWGTAAPVDALNGLELEFTEGRMIDPNARGIEVIVGSEYLNNYFFTKHKLNQDYWQQPPIDETVDLLSVRFEGNFGDIWSYTQDEQFVIEGEDPPTPPPALVDMRVVGILAPTGGTEDYSCYMDLSKYKEFIRKNKKFAENNYMNADYQSVSVRAEDMDQVMAVQEEIKNMGFQAYSNMEIVEQMQQESERQQVFWAIVGAIALLVSAIGIVNTMLTSIMERKREIGVMKVLGCSLGTLNAVYIMEAAFIGLIGGLIGLGLSFGVTAILSDPAVLSGFSTFMGGMGGEGVRFVISLDLCLITAGGAMLLGILAGLYPAIRAMHMSPLAALREE